MESRYANNEAVVLKDALAAGEIKLGDELILHDGATSSSNDRAYRIVDIDSTHDTIVLMTGVSENQLKWREAPDAALYDEVRVYPGSTLDQYLTQGDFWNSFPEEYKKILVPRTITYTDLVETSPAVWRPEVKTNCSRSIFIASASELGAFASNAEVEGDTFQWFSGNVDAKSRRTNNYTPYWTRTRHKASALLDGNKNLAYYVDKDGDLKTDFKWTKRYYRVCINITNRCIVSRSGSFWYITPDLPPSEVPGASTTVQVRNDEPYTASWTAASDTCDPTTYCFADKKRTGSPRYTVWYKVKKLIYKESGTSPVQTEELVQNLSHTVSFPYSDKVYKAEIFVQALDCWDNYSDWSKVLTINVINNAPPYQPGRITSSGGYKGDRIAIAWEPNFDTNGRLDPDNNFTGYKVRRSINGGEPVVLTTTTSRRFIDNESDSASSWEYVTYHVSAYDEYGEESTRSEVTIYLRDRVTLQLSAKNEQSTQGYLLVSDSIADAPRNEDGHGIVVPVQFMSENKLLTFVVEDSLEGHHYNSVINMFRCDTDDLVTGAITRDFTLDQRGEHELTLSVPENVWCEVKNGTYRIDCFVIDNDKQENQISKSVFFKKTYDRIQWTLPTIEFNDEAEKYLLNIDMHIPGYGTVPSESGRSYDVTVMISRNVNSRDGEDIGNAEWTTITEHSGYNSLDFANLPSAPAGSTDNDDFSVVVSVERTFASDEARDAFDYDADSECYINSIRGMVGENIFAKIQSQIEAINARITGYHPQT